MTDKPYMYGFYIYMTPKEIETMEMIFAAACKSEWGDSEYNFETSKAVRAMSDKFNDMIKGKSGRIAS